MTTVPTQYQTVKGTADFVLKVLNALPSKEIYTGGFAVFELDGAGDDVRFCVKGAVTAFLGGYKGIGKGETYRVSESEVIRDAGLASCVTNAMEAFTFATARKYDDFTPQGRRAIWKACKKFVQVIKSKSEEVQNLDHEEFVDNYASLVLPKRR